MYVARLVKFQKVWEVLDTTHAKRVARKVYRGRSSAPLSRLHLVHTRAFIQHALESLLRGGVHPELMRTNLRRLVCMPLTAVCCARFLLQVCTSIGEMFVDCGKSIGRCICPCLMGKDSGNGY